MQKDGVWNFEVSCPEATAEKNTNTGLCTDAKSRQKQWI